MVTQHHIKPPMLQFEFPMTDNLASIQMFLGNLTWMCLSVSLTPTVFTPHFNLLWNINSSDEIKKLQTAKESLNTINKALNNVIPQLYDPKLWSGT